MAHPSTPAVVVAVGWNLAETHKVAIFTTFTTQGGHLYYTRRPSLLAANTATSGANAIIVVIYFRREGTMYILSIVKSKDISSNDVC